MIYQAWMQAHQKNWRTPVDFLGDYIKFVLTPEWGKAELRKPMEDRHQIIQWYQIACTPQQEQSVAENGLIKTYPSGRMMAYYLLAHDLFTIHVLPEYQQTLIPRLKNKDQYQGARHELFAAAACIRSGFKLLPEDESDGSSKHPEFLGLHQQSGQAITVEAKSKHRPGVLGFPGSAQAMSEIRVKIRGLINNALEKPFLSPYVIFVDLNLPPSYITALTEEWFAEVVAPTLDTNDVWTLLVLTNFPDHYSKDLAPGPEGYAIGIMGRNPKYPAAHSQILHQLYDNVNNYGLLPNSLSEMGIP